MKKECKGKIPKPGTKEYIDSICGIFEGAGISSEDFLKERRKDDAMWMKKMERIEKSMKKSDNSRQ